ncbi:MAG: undecaprenyldiphospho-muramoylpentapeptide beta-N-acetylglucosaminyltransferase [Acidobacteriaceae bacterium]
MQVSRSKTQHLSESAPQHGGLRVLMAGGGTGGHVIPALAIARELRDRYAAEVHFVGTARGMETRLVPEAGFLLDLIHVGQLKNVRLTIRLRTLADLPLGILRCIRLLRDFKPQVVVGVGGYASGPAMMAALLLRIPTLAFEPNAVPGLANRIVGKWVSAAAVNFAPTCRYFRNAQVTGIPVRSEFFALAPRSADAPLHLLVFGGSQGARALNETMPRIASQLLAAFPTLTILHQAGASLVEGTRQGYLQSDADASRWQVWAFLDDMPQRFADADLILCRSGASTVAELAAAGKPSLLVPFPRAADDHQRKNAEVLAEAGAAQLLLESEATPHRLLTELTTLLQNREKLARMSEAARSLAHPDALQAIGQIVKRLAEGSASR